MQAYDFLYLCEHQKCILQMGGSDQWGNITAGIDLIRRVRGEKTYGLTLPLVTTSSGEKFGKSAGNAIWLDPTLTSPFRFYQYWLQVDDRDVDRFLKCFTFLAVSDIARIVDRHTLEPELRTGQRTLAVELTRCVHGADGLDRAVKATEILFGAEIQGLSEQELLDVFTDVPSACVPSDRLSGRLALVEVLVEARLFASKGEARRLIESGGLYVNNRRVSATDVQISQDLLAAGNISVIRKGKKDYTLLRFAD
jgi:tyrosyl-tRNA synthetase